MRCHVQVEQRHGEAAQEIGALRSVVQTMEQQMAEGLSMLQAKEAAVQVGNQPGVPGRALVPGTHVTVGCVCWVLVSVLADTR